MRLYCFNHQNRTLQHVQFQIPNFKKITIIEIHWNDKDLNLNQELFNMKERLRSSQSSKNQEMVQKSAYQSPKYQRQAQNNEYMNEEMQYKLQKIFEQAGNRQQRYINIIKEQEQKMNKQSQVYLQSLKDIKTSFLEFITNSNKNNKQQWKALKVQQQFANKKSLNKINSQQFSIKTLKKYSNSQYRTEPELQCKMNCYYYTPFVDDAIRYQMPQKLVLRIRNFYPNIVMSKEIKIIKQQDEADNLNYLLNKVPFQISTQNNEAIIINFKIPCNQDAISYYKRKQFQMELVNKQGMFVFAYAKISLKSILYYEEHQTQWQLKPVSFYSTLDGVKVGQMSIKLGNKLETVDKNDHYKIQSTNPMQINNLKSLINYNDDQSRMIQRISKFKTNTNSLLLGMGNNREINKQRYFENENDKILVMHRQKKELQSILEYKNSHKSQLMDKLFSEAIDKYYLTQCQVGCPKFISFNYQNKSKNHIKIFAKISITCKNYQNKPINSKFQSILQHIQISLLPPAQAKSLQAQERIQILDSTHLDYQLEIQQQSFWSISSMNHCLIVKIICLPFKHSLQKQADLKSYYELQLTLSDEYNQQLQIFQSKIKIKEPSLENTLYIHGYSQTQSQIQIPFDNEDKVVKKNILTNISDLQYKWNNNHTRLNLKVSHQNQGEKAFYVIVNDANNLYQISCYQLLICTYPKLTESLILQLGEVKKIHLQFSLGDDILTQKYRQIQGTNASKPTSGKDQLRLLFRSSKPQHCVVTCQNQPELLCKLNKVYSVDAKIQTFDDKSNPQKILIHAMDLDTQKVVKRWLLLLQKQSLQNYKHIYKLSCEHNKPMRYKFQFMNEDFKQKSFRFYSSNLSIMSVPFTLIPLITNQRAAVELQFHVRIAMSPEDALQPLRVILTVTDGSTFNNFLFQINVRIK